MFLQLYQFNSLNYCNYNEYRLKIETETLCIFFFVHVDYTNSYITGPSEYINKINAYLGASLNPTSRNYVFPNNTNFQNLPGIYSEKSQKSNNSNRLIISFVLHLYLTCHDQDVTFVLNRKSFTLSVTDYVLYYSIRETGETLFISRFVPNKDPSEYLLCLFTCQSLFIGLQYVN